jgi:hypothetical protein
MQCPLCLNNILPGQSSVVLHLSRHLEDIALAALPREVASDTEAEDDEEQEGPSGHSLSEILRIGQPDQSPQWPVEELSDSSSALQGFDDHKPQSNEDESFKAAIEPSEGYGRPNFVSELPKLELDFVDTATYDKLLHNSWKSSLDGASPSQTENIGEILNGSPEDRGAPGLNKTMGTPNRAITLGASSWQGNVNLQPQHYDNTFSVAQMQYQRPILPLDPSYYGPNLHTPSQCGTQIQQPSKQLQSTPPHQSHTYNEALPAYTPVTPDLQPPVLNPQQRYPPSVCHQCGKTFTGKYGTGNCKRHVQQSHGPILDRVINECKVCMKTYNRADALRWHQWKKHGLEDSRPSKRRQ